MKATVTDIPFEVIDRESQLKEICESFIKLDMESVASRIKEVLEDDEDDGSGSKQLNVESLLGFLIFSKRKKINHKRLIGVSHEGYLGVEWHINQDILISIRFYDQINLRYYFEFKGNIERGKTDIDSVIKLLDKNLEI